MNIVTLEFWSKQVMGGAVQGACQEVPPGRLQDIQQGARVVDCQSVQHDLLGPPQLSRAQRVRDRHHQDPKTETKGSQIMGGDWKWRSKWK